MRARIRQQLIMTILALLVGMGTVLSAVQANDMVVKMAVAGDPGSSGMNGCTACGGDDGNAKQANCIPACVTTAFGLLPATMSLASDATVSPSMSLHAAPRGSAGVPDPSPPRLSILG